MRVVVDASVVAASLVRPKGWTAAELRRTDVQWLTPSFLFDELSDHEVDLAHWAGCSQEEFRNRVSDLRRVLKTVSAASLVRSADDPLVRRAEEVDADDAAYFAAFVATKADYLWTRDRKILEAFPGIAVRIIPTSAASPTGGETGPRERNGQDR